MATRESLIFASRAHRVMFGICMRSEALRRLRLRHAVVVATVHQ
jgi:hypothetical protein